MSKHQVQSDLDSLKEFIESRGTETGAWLGDVEAGSLGSPRGRVAGIPSADRVDGSAGPRTGMTPA